MTNRLRSSPSSLDPDIDIVRRAPCAPGDIDGSIRRQLATPHDADRLVGDARSQRALADVLRAMRAACGLGQEQWAADLQVSRKTVQRWERAEATPDARAEATIVALCRARRAFASALTSVVAVEGGELDAGAELLEQSLVTLEQAGDRWGMVRPLNNLGEVARARGDLERAGELLGNRLGVAAGLELLGLALVDHDPAEAARSFDAAAELRHLLGAPAEARDRERIERARTGPASSVTPA